MNKSAQTGEKLHDRKRSWYTALYYFSEHIRRISGGAITNKVLYSLVGTRGHYVNHRNAAMRASSAPELSRLIHSERYAEDFRSSHKNNKLVFDTGAASLCNMLVNLTHLGENELFTLLSETIWKDVAVGFANEKSQGRRELDLARINREMQNVFEHFGSVAPKNRTQWLVSILSSYFHVLSYGHIDSALARLLTAKTMPAANDVPFRDCFQNGEEAEKAEEACLMRICGKAVVGGIWLLDPLKETTIGRYTDCDIAEATGYVSRLHCGIYRKDGKWILEDAASTHGTVVIRKGRRIAVRSCPGSPSTLVLHHGDLLLLADRARYWFGMLHRQAMQSGCLSFFVNCLGD